MNHLPSIAIFPPCSTDEGVELKFTILLSDEGDVSLDINGTIWNGNLGEVLKSGWRTLELDDSEKSEVTLLFKDARENSQVTYPVLEVGVMETSAVLVEETQAEKRQRKIAQGILNAYDAGRNFVAKRRKGRFEPQGSKPLRR